MEGGLKLPFSNFKQFQSLGRKRKILSSKRFLNFTEFCGFFIKSYDGIPGFNGSKDVYKIELHCHNFVQSLIIKWERGVLLY